MRACTHPRAFQIKGQRPRALQLPRFIRLAPVKHLVGVHSMCLRHSDLATIIETGREGIGAWEPIDGEDELVTACCVKVVSRLFLLIPRMIVSEACGGIAPRAFSTQILAQRPLGYSDGHPECPLGLSRN